MSETLRTPDARTVLVTGGAGYIGSHTCVCLLAAGFVPVIFDNLSNSKRAVLSRIERVAGVRPRLIEGDVRDAAALRAALRDSGAAAVMHFAGLKAVGESVREPLAYYEHNVCGSHTLLGAMRDAGVHTLVFSSSATVYGDPDAVPVPETAPLRPANPYGHTKHMVEQMMADLHASAPDTWRLARLRYFNPVGAHPSGLMGEDPSGVPNNLMPYVTQVAIGRRARLQVFGGDYPTPDGTGVRDYIHVMDLAEGHVAALRRLQTAGGLLTVNLGTGRGTSVLALVQAFGRAAGRPLPYEVVARRAGDVAVNYADPAQAQALLGWQATRDLDTMCADSWRWQRDNPQGYPDD